MEKLHFECMFGDGVTFQGDPKGYTKDEVELFGKLKSNDWSIVVKFHSSIKSLVVIFATGLQRKFNNIDFLIHENPSVILVVCANNISNGTRKKILKHMDKDPMVKLLHNKFVGHKINN